MAVVQRIVSTLLAIGVVGALTPARGLAGQTPPRPDFSRDALVRKTADYIVQYEQDFAFLLADETTTQQVVGLDGHVINQRTTTGEFFITYVPEVHQWVAVHDVQKVDGTPVPDRQDVGALLDRESIQSVARQLLARNARFNIGVRRNFNEPTLPLIVFNDVHRTDFDFSRGAVDRGDPSVTLVTLGFHEQSPATMIHDADTRQAVPIRGNVLIDATTGGVRRGHIDLKDGAVTASLDTTFTPDHGVGMWVPTLFTERYTLDRKGDHEITVCDTRLTNYRKFETSGRLK